MAQFLSLSVLDHRSSDTRICSGLCAPYISGFPFVVENPEHSAAARGE